MLPAPDSRSPPLRAILAFALIMVGGGRLLLFPYFPMRFSRALPPPGRDENAGGFEFRALERPRQR